jgi:hypothetical protein
LYSDDINLPPAYQLHADKSMDVMRFAGAISIEQRIIDWLTT